MTRRARSRNDSRPPSCGRSGLPCLERVPRFGRRWCHGPVGSSRCFRCSSGRSAARMIRSRRGSGCTTCASRATTRSPTASSETCSRRRRPAGGPSPRRSGSTRRPSISTCSASRRSTPTTGTSTRASLAIASRPWAGARARSTSSSPSRRARPRRSRPWTLHGFPAAEEGRARKEAALLGRRPRPPLRLRLVRHAQGAPRRPPQGGRLRLRRGARNGRDRPRQARGDGRPREPARTSRAPRAHERSTATAASPRASSSTASPGRRGDLYDPRDLATTQGRLYDLGVFSSVRVDLPPAPTEVADVAIAVKPGPLHEVRTGGGLGIERIREEARGPLRVDHQQLPGWPAPAAAARAARLCRHPVGRDRAATAAPPPRTTCSSRSRTCSAAASRRHALAGYDLGIAEGYQYYGPRAQLGLERPFFRDRLLVGGSWNLQYLEFFNVDEDVFGGGEREVLRLREPLPPRLRRGVRAARPAQPAARSDLRRLPGAARRGGRSRRRRRLPLRQAQPRAAPLRAARPSRRAGGARPRRAGSAPTAASRAPSRVAFAGRSVEPPRLRLRAPSPQARASDGTLIPYGGDGEVLFSGDLRIDVTKVGGNWLDLVPFVDAGDVTTTFAAARARATHTSRAGCRSSTRRPSASCARARACASTASEAPTPIPTTGSPSTSRSARPSDDARAACQGSARARAGLRRGLGR